MVIDCKQPLFPVAGKKIMLINFYADWCRYSAALKPVYDKAADQVAVETVSIKLLMPLLKLQTEN